MNAAQPGGRARLVPELVVTDLDRSLAFWRDLVGFRILYGRPEDPFAFLERDGAEVMLDEYDPDGRHWVLAPFAPPLGTGMNLQVSVADVAPLLARLRAAGWPLLLEPEDKWYRAGEVENGQRQFVVADPDGYLLRPAQALGSRPV